MGKKQVKENFNDDRKRAIKQAQEAIADISVRGKIQREMISAEQDRILSQMEERALQESNINHEKSVLLDRLTSAAQQGNLEEMKRIRAMLNELPER